MHSNLRKQILEEEIEALEIMDILEEILISASCFRINCYPIPVFNSSFISGKYYKNNQINSD